MKYLLSLSCLCVALQSASAAESVADLAARQARVEASMEAGQEAAKRGDWMQAAEHFEQAEYGNVYPAPPAVYFNIALANDRLGGREVKALGFYRAYLTLSPQARNRAAISAAGNGPMRPPTSICGSSSPCSAAFSPESPGWAR